MRSLIDILLALIFVFGMGPNMKSIHDEVLKTLAERHRKGFSSSEKFAQALTDKRLEW